jgi:antirestriction protein
MEQEPQLHPEREPDDAPRIYVASLSDYNAGRLHGTWIDATQQAEELHEEIHTMLAESTEEIAEEWAIHDYEGFGPLRLSEYESIDTVTRIAVGIAEHGIAFAHWAALVGTGDDELASFNDHYLGHWPSIGAYAAELVDDFGVQQELDRLTLPFREYIHIDIDALARDLDIEYLSAEDNDGVHIWEQP